MFLNDLFEKINFEKKSAEDNKSMTKYLVCKEFNIATVLNSQAVTACEHYDMNMDFVHLTIFTFSKQAFNESLDFFNNS